MFSPIALSLGQIGFIYSRLDDEELRSSPDSIRKGFPSTMSCVAAPRFSRCGGAMGWLTSWARASPG